MHPISTPNTGPLAFKWSSRPASYGCLGGFSGLKTTASLTKRPIYLSILHPHSRLILHASVGSCLKGNVHHFPWSPILQYCLPLHFSHRSYPFSCFGRGVVPTNFNTLKPCYMLTFTYLKMHCTVFRNKWYHTIHGVELLLLVLGYDAAISREGPISLYLQTSSPAPGRAVRSRPSRPSNLEATVVDAGI